MEVGFRRRRPLMHGETRAWVSLVLLGLVAVMVPWTLWLSVVLPAHHTSHDWDATWVGFDVVLLVALGLTAVAYRRHWPALPLLAAAAGVARLGGPARAACYISRRPESARPSVTSSAYSRSPPTGSPLASLVTLTRSRSRSAR